VNETRLREGCGEILRFAQDDNSSLRLPREGYGEILRFAQDDNSHTG
jgi:hypothetical protein